MKALRDIFICIVLCYLMLNIPKGWNKEAQSFIYSDLGKFLLISILVIVPFFVRYIAYLTRSCLSNMFRARQYISCPVIYYIVTSFAVLFISEYLILNGAEDLDFSNQLSFVAVLLFELSIFYLIITDLCLQSSKPEHDMPEDVLNRGVFVTKLYKELVSSKPAISALWIDGQWGDGKSWVIDELIGRLKQEEDKGYVTFKYEPWLYVYDNYPEKIISNFYQQLLHKLSESYDVGDIDRSFERFLNNILGSVQKGYVGNILLNFHKDYGLDDLKNSLNDFISKNDIKLIVVIDELDRLDPKESLVSLRLIRNLSDLYNTKVVISACKKTVEKSLSREGVSRGYLEKISQDTRLLPLASIDDLYAALSKDVEGLIEDEILKKDVMSSFRSYLNGDVFSLANFNLPLSNLRRKDVIFSFLTTYYDEESPNESILRELDISDLIVLIMLRTVNGEAYNLIKNSEREFVRSFSDLDNLDNNLNVKRKDYITSLITELTEHTRCTLKESMFIKWSIDKLFDDSHWEYAGEAKNNRKRLQNPEYFHRYFSDGWNSYLLPIFRCVKIIENLNNGLSLDSKDCTQFWDRDDQVNWFLYKLKREFSPELKDNAKLNLSLHLIQTYTNDWKYKYHGEPAQITDFRTFDFNKDKGILDALEVNGYEPKLLVLVDYANSCFWNFEKKQKDIMKFDYLQSIADYTVNVFKSIFNENPLGLLNCGGGFEEKAYHFSYYWIVIERLSKFEKIQDEQGKVKLKYAPYNDLISNLRCEMFDKLCVKIGSNFDNLCMYLLTFCENPVRERSDGGGFVYSIDWSWISGVNFDKVKNYKNEIKFIYQTYIKQGNHLAEFGSEWNDYSRKHPKKREFIESALRGFYSYIHEQDNLKNDIDEWDREIRKEG